MDDELKSMLGNILVVVEATRADVARLEVGQAELKADVAEIKAVQAEHGQRLDRIETGQAELKSDVAEIKTDVAVLKVGQAQILDHLDVAELKGRVEEQSRTIAQLIPVRVAAVPGR